MRLAYVSPLSPQRSGVSDYSEELLPWLARYAEVDLVVDGYTPTNPEIAGRFRTLDIQDFAVAQRRPAYPAVLYHLGNSPSHAYAYRSLGVLPGVTVLHDFFLHHLVVELTVAQGDPAAYVREMAYCHSQAGVEAAWAALRNGHRFPYLDYPVNQRVLDASLGVIVHSEYVRDLVAAAAPQTPVMVIPLHARLDPEAVDEPTVRRTALSSIGIDPGDLVFAAFGLATPAKRLDVALRAFHRVRAALPAAQLLIVGEVPPGSDLGATIAALGLGDAVVTTGYMSKADLLRLIQAVDVGINLRGPTLGETSSVLLRLLAAGKPVVVSDIGAFAEIPDDCCWKVPVGGEEEVARVAQAMLALASEPDRRKQLGERARAHVAAHHTVDRVAAQYAAFLHRVFG